MLESRRDGKGRETQPYPAEAIFQRNRRAAMSIQEFHSKMSSKAGGDRLLEALRRLQAVEDTRRFRRQLSFLGPWNAWPE